MKREDVKAQIEGIPPRVQGIDLFGKEKGNGRKEKEALRELLKILSDCPELADRITITVRPNSRPQQGERQEE